MIQYKYIMYINTIHIYFQVLSYIVYISARIYIYVCVYKKNTEPHESQRDHGELCVLNFCSNKNLCPQNNMFDCLSKMNREYPPRNDHISHSQAVTFDSMNFGLSHLVGYVFSFPGGDFYQIWFSWSILRYISS